MNNTDFISLQQIAEEAFRAGYKERELDTREDDPITNSIIERKFSTWWDQNYD